MSLTIYIQDAPKAEDSVFRGLLDGITTSQGLGLQKALYNESNITTRSTEHSFTVEHLATKNNNDIFSQLFDASILVQESGQFTPEFNPRKKAYVQVLQGSDLLLDGFLKLTDIVISKENRVVYQCTYYAKELDIFTAAGEAYLTDLDLSEYNHEYTADNIQASWEATIIINGSPEPFELGVGYVYPMIEYGQVGALAKPENWYWNDFRPAIYAKQYWDKIFAAAGFTYQSDFINSERFKRLILPYTNGEFRLSSSEVTSRGYYVTQLTDTLSELYGGSVSTADPVVYSNESIAPAFDNSSQYNLITGKVTIGKTGLYTFSFGIEGRLKKTVADTTSGTTPTNLTLRLAVVRNSGGVFSTLGIFSQIAVHPSPAGTIPQNTFSDVFITPQFTTLEATINAGDEIFIAALDVKMGLTTFNDLWQLETKNSSDSYFFDTASASIAYGDTLDINSVIPIKYKQKDFLADIMRMFNLCFEAHPTLSNVIIIEPRDEGFYTDEVVNLENKLDLETEHKVIPNLFTGFKTYRFAYSEDSDKYNKLYFDAYGEPYGTLNVNIDNDFNGATNELKVSFAPTPLIGQPQAAPTTGRVISSIEFADANGNPVPTAGKPRLLYYNKKTAGPAWNLWDNANVNAGPYTTYPYAGHLDDQFEPVFDLNFGLPQVIYYQSVGPGLVAGASTVNFNNNQTVYDIYWRTTVREIESSNARGFEGNFEISFPQYRALSFRKLYYFEKQYWRLMQVVDFECTMPKLTPLIFTKALTLPAIPTESAPVNGGEGFLGNTELRLPGVNRPTRLFNNQHPDNAGTIGGTNNRVQGAGGNTVTILNGSDNYVPAGFERITLINTSGYEVTESNITVISGQTYHEGPVTFNSDVNIGADTLADYINNTVAGVNGSVSVSTDYTVAAGIKTVFAAGGAGGIEITLPAPAEERTLQIIKTDNTPGAVDLIGHDVNGAALSLTLQYDKCIIISDGTNYYRLG